MLNLSNSQRSKMERVITHEMREMVRSERTRQLLMLQRNERYWRGNHYHFPTFKARTIDWSSASGNMISDPAVRSPRGIYDYVLNYYYGDGLKLVGVLGLEPNAKASADVNIPELQARQQKANEIIRLLGPHWQTELIQLELVLSLFKNGTSFGYTSFIANDRAYGKISIPTINMVKSMVSPERYACTNCLHEQVEPVECQECGAGLTEDHLMPAEYADVPQLGNPLEFANGSVEFKLCNSYTVITPFYLKTLDDSPWLIYEYEEFTSNLLAAFPESRDVILKIRGETQPDTEDTARRHAASFMGSYTPASRNMLRYTRAWIEPQMFAMFDGDDMRMLESEFPNGAKITMVGTKILKMEPESHREVWAACKPTVGEYLYPQPLGNPYIRLNDLINDGFNIMAQTAEKGIPIHFVDPRVINLRALTENEANVMEFYPILSSNMGKLSDAIWSTEPAKLNPTTTQMMESALGAARQIVSLTEPLWGGSPDRQQTLGETEIRRNQALTSHNSTWTYIRNFWARCYENAVIQFAKHGTGKLYFKSRTGSSLPPRPVDIGDCSDLLHGGWHVSVDKNIPMTYGQARAQFWQMLENPQAVQLFGLGHPDNTEALYEALGTDMLKIPGKDARDKVLEIIGKLLGESPIMPPPPDPFAPPDPMAPPPMPMPSIPIDEWEDDHLLSATLVKEWAQTREARHQKEINRAGYDNVIAWGRAHLDVANMLAMQQAGPAPEEEGGPPPGGGGGPPSPGVEQPEEMAAPITEGI